MRLLAVRLLDACHTCTQSSFMWCMASVRAGTRAWEENQEHQPRRRDRTSPWVPSQALLRQTSHPACSPPSVLPSESTVDVVLSPAARGESLTGSTLPHVEPATA